MAAQGAPGTASSSSPLPEMETRTRDFLEEESIPSPARAPQPSRAALSCIYFPGTHTYKAAHLWLGPALLCAACSAELSLKHFLYKEEDFFIGFLGLGVGVREGGRSEVKMIS